MARKFKIIKKNDGYELHIMSYGMDNETGELLLIKII